MLAPPGQHSLQAEEVKPEASDYLRPQDVVLFLGDSNTAETKYYWFIFHDDLKQKYPKLATGDVPYKKGELVAAGIKFINGGVSGDVAEANVRWSTRPVAH